MAPIRPVANLTNGALVTAIYRAMGGAPSPIVRRAFQLTSIDKELTKPIAVATHLHDREFLAAPEVRLETAPGGHLGVLAGRSARTTTWRHLDRFLGDPAPAARDDVPDEPLAA